MGSRFLRGRLLPIPCSFPKRIDRAELSMLRVLVLAALGILHGRTYIGHHHRRICSQPERCNNAPSGFDSLLGHAYGRAGNHAQAMAIARELENRIREGWSSAAELAIVYLGLGEDEEALDVTRHRNVAIVGDAGRRESPGNLHELHTHPFAEVMVFTVRRRACQLEEVPRSQLGRIQRRAAPPRRFDGLV